MLERFSAAKSPVKIGPQNGGFWKFKGLNISNIVIETPKALTYPERRLLTYFA